MARSMQAVGKNCCNWVNSDLGEDKSWAIDKLVRIRSHLRYLSIKSSPEIVEVRFYRFRNPAGGEMLRKLIAKFIFGLVSNLRREE